MAAMNITNGTIEEIFPERNNTLVTVVYQEGIGNRREEKRLRMVVSSTTVIINTNNTTASPEELKVGMKINAIVSNMMTRSVPPQAEAYFIEILEESPEENVARGRIIELDNENRNFTMIYEGNFCMAIKFNVPRDTPVTDSMGRNIGFRGLNTGMRVEVRYGNFTTASIPPQTTAKAIKVL